MYWRDFVCDGDTTVPTSGKVRAKDNGISFNGLNACFEGDPIFCPACDSMGYTKCVPPYRVFTGHDGRQINLGKRGSIPCGLLATNGAHCCVAFRSQ